MPAPSRAASRGRSDADRRAPGRPRGAEAGQSAGTRAAAAAVPGVSLRTRTGTAWRASNPGIENAAGRGDGHSMSDDVKSVNDLEREVETLRARVAELERWNLEAEQAGEALRRSEEAFRKIFDHSNDAIFVVDPHQDVIVDVNNRACQLLGYTCDEMHQLSLASIFPEDAERLREAMTRVAEAGTGWVSEVASATRSGARLPSEISISMIQLGKRPHLIALVRDISERRRAQDELRRAHDRMTADLEAAAQLQRALLPCSSPVIDGLRSAWHVRPSERLAGDAVNVFRLDDHHVGFYLLDVSGHGVKAAMLSVTLHRILTPFPVPLSTLVEQTRLGPRILAPREVAARLNRTFQMSDGTGQYFTLFYGVLDLRDRTLRFVSAGQGAPVLVRADGTAREIEHFDHPIGILPDAAFEDHTVTLEPGSTLLVYSDGLVETFDEGGEPFGRERLIEAIRETLPHGLQESLAEVVERVDRFGCAECIRDDMSLVAIQLTR